MTASMNARNTSQSIPPCPPRTSLKKSFQSGCSYSFAYSSALPHCDFQSNSYRLWTPSMKTESVSSKYPPFVPRTVNPRLYPRGSVVSRVSVMVCPFAHLITVVTTSPCKNSADASLSSFPFALNIYSLIPFAQDAVEVSETIRLPLFMSSTLAIGPSSWVG